MTEPRPLSHVVAACDGTLLQGSGAERVLGVCTDTRRLVAGQLFVALKGEQFDGHAFVAEAERKGAGAVMLEVGRSRPEVLQGPVVGVANTRRGLAGLAGSWRRELAVPAIAIAGSNGKTTTKELVAAVLRERFPTLTSPASYNNDVGVPLALLGLERQHEVAVLEVGTNHPGELAPLVGLIRPQLGVLTSLGREHLEHFGDLAGVVEEEGWLAELLPADGRLFVHADSPMIDRVIRRSKAPVITTGWSAGCDWRAVRTVADETGVEFEVACPDATRAGVYRVNLVGRHQVGNALLALAVGAHFGLTRAELAHGLAVCRPLQRRMESWVANGTRVLDDAYNANADSMNVALQTLCDFPCAGRRIAVLGDMAESGPEGPTLHAALGRQAAELGVDQLIAVGAMAPLIGEAARSAGLFRVLEFPEPGVAAQALIRLVRPGDVVLVKASRRLRLERVTDALRGGLETA